MYVARCIFYLLEEMAFVKSVIGSVDGFTSFLQTFPLVAVALSGYSQTSNKFTHYTVQGPRPF